MSSQKFEERKGYWKGSSHPFNNHNKWMSNVRLSIGTILCDENAVEGKGELLMSLTITPLGNMPFLSPEIEVGQRGMRRDGVGDEKTVRMKMWL